MLFSSPFAHTCCIPPWLAFDLAIKADPSLPFDLIHSLFLLVALLCLVQVLAYLFRSFPSSFPRSFPRPLTLSHSRISRRFQHCTPDICLEATCIVRNTRICTTPTCCNTMTASQLLFLVAEAEQAGMDADMDAGRASGEQ